MTFVATPFARFLFWLDLAVCACALLGALWRLRKSRRAGEARSLALAGFAVLGASYGLAPWIAWGVLDGTIRGFCLAVRALWTGATVAAPALALGAAAVSRRPRWAVLAAALVALKWWGEVGEPARLEIERATIEVEGLRSPVKVAHFSDLQTDGIRPMELRAREAANAFDPEFVVFTGDVMNHRSLAPSVFEYLSGWKARRAKLFVGGDVDAIVSRAELKELAGFEAIDGRAKIFQAGGARLAFLGFGLFDYRRGESHAELLVRSAKADAFVALAHRPDTAFALRGLPVSALFAGHTHGGQVVIPGFGPPVTLTRVPRDAAAGGVRRFEGLTLSLSRGFGWEGHLAPRVRLFCRPHLILAELVPPRGGSDKMPPHAASPAPASRPSPARRGAR